MYLYTNALLVHLGFLLNKKGPKTINDAYYMAMQIEENISLSKRKHIFSLGTKVYDPKGTPDTLTLERLLSLDIFERREQVINQQEVEESDPNEVFQSHEEGQEFTHASTEDNEDMVKEREPRDIKHDDEVSICAPPSDEAIHEPFPPTQEEEDEVSHFPFQVLDNALFYDSESEGEVESSGKVDPPCCTVEDVGATHEDKTMIHVEDTQVLEAPAQEEINTGELPSFPKF
jgi:hypothetical protein